MSGKQGFIKNIARMFCGHASADPPGPPVVKADIPLQAVYTLLADLFPQTLEKVHVSDKWYQITSIAELRRFVKWDNANQFPYVNELHDCDDFALALAGAFARFPQWSGYPVGIIWADAGAGPHAFIIAVAWPSLDDQWPRIYFIEPQSDWEISEENVQALSLQLLQL